jgi:trigger factor
MNVEVTRLPESRVTLSVELTPEEVEGALDRTYRQLVHRVNIPGFRKGKAPRPVVERMLGPETFLHEATDEAVRWGYRKAIDQENLSPLELADIDVPGDDHAHLHPGEPFRFEATVAVRPQVELPDYHAISVTRPEVEVTDEDVQNLMDELRERSATLEPVQRPAQIGDTVTMNLTAKVGGEEVFNQEDYDYPLRTEEENEGTVTMFPGMAEQLDGTRPGDIKELTLPLPENYPQEEWAGKTMFVRALVKEVKRTVLPEVDDDFVQSVSNFQTPEELTEALRSNIESERRQQADEQLVRESVDALTSRTFVDIPPVLIEEELDRMINDLRQAFEQQGMAFDLYLSTIGKSEEEMRNELREGATDNVKRSLVLGALADAENIEISNKDVDGEIDVLLRGLRTGAAERRRIRNDTDIRSGIRSRLRRQRATRRLVEIATGESIPDSAADVDETAPPDIVAEEPESTAPTPSAAS